MNIDQTDIQAKVYTKNAEKGIYYIKASIPSLKMYINSITVRPSTKYGDMWFQMPSFAMGKKWVRPIEFNGDSQFLELIKDATFRAVDEYQRDHENSISTESAINLDEINF
jgi:hypothetical protein